MQSSGKIFRLTGVIQHYPWGGTHFIPALLQQENREAKPVAEYWLGAHDNAPAKIYLPGKESANLNVFIEENREHILGKQVANRFGRLPYLLKILDVKDMLSIQVHPDETSARKAFEEENKKRIPINAPERNYKDANHKPELMVALSEFWLLHGFKSKEKLSLILSDIPELNFLAPVFHEQGYKALYQTVMNMVQDKVNHSLQPLLARVIPLYKKNSLSKDQEDFWAARAALTFGLESNIDRGIFSIYFFNLVHCKPGDAIFQDAGVPHAYLEGQNVEIMANSDNVLRGGLTSKHINVGELMKHIKFEGTHPNTIVGKKRGSIEEVYETPAPDFELSSFQFDDQNGTSFMTSTADIIFVEKGSVKIISEAQEVTLRRGEAVIVFSNTEVELSSFERTQLFRATVPVRRME